MNTVANRTRERDLSMASNLVRGTRPPVPTFAAQRNGCETFRGCRGSEKDVFFGLNKYSRNVHKLSKKLKTIFTMLVDKLTRPGNFEHPRAGSTGNLHRTNALKKMVWSDQGCHMATRGAIQELI